MLRSAWLWITGLLLGSLALLKSIFFRRVRLETEAASVLYDQIRSEGRNFVLQEEITTGERLPRVFSAICWLHGRLFKFDVTERMLRAGFQGTDSVAEVTGFRWQIPKLLEAVKRKPIKVEEISVFIMDSWGSARISKRKVSELTPNMYVATPRYSAFEQDIKSVVAGDLKRTSALIYGPPGNGKSFLVRHLALKYGLDIHLAILSPDFDNQMIVRMFSHVTGPAFILIEDFDAYFDERKCLVRQAKFTFDAILNVLDGTHVNLDKVVVAMTANDVSKIDLALRARPGRLRHVIEIPNPAKSIRERIFNGHPRATTLVRDLDGCNLDELLAARDSEELAEKARDRIMSGRAIERVPLFFKDGGDREKEKETESIKKAE